MLTRIFLTVPVIIAQYYISTAAGKLTEPNTIREISRLPLTGIYAEWRDVGVSVGASGAVFGLYGVFVAPLITKVYPPEIARTALVSTLVFIAYNLIMGMTGDIDNAAHIGGWLSGFVIGLILYPTLKQAVNKHTD